MKRAILLAAGEGQRLRPLTAAMPKCLVPVHGKPLLGRWIEQLAAAGVHEVLVNTNYLAETVESYLAGGQWPCRVNVVRELRLRGTGGSLSDFVGFWERDGALLIHADNLTDMDLGAFIAAHEKQSAGMALTLATFESPEPSQCGIVVCDGDFVTEFHEKVSSPPGNRASAAVFALNPALVEALPGKSAGMLDFSRDVVPSLVGSMKAWHHGGFHRDIGDGERYLSAQWEFAASPGRPDKAWSALLRKCDGALMDELVKKTAELAVIAGYEVCVLDHSDQIAGTAGHSEGRLVIVKTGGRGYSSHAYFRQTGLRSIVLEVEE